MSTSQKVNNLQLSETTAGINFHFAIVTEEEILQLLTCLECTVLLPSLYVLTPLFSSIMVNSCFWNTSHVPTNILPLFTLISENNCFLLLLLLLLLGQVKKKNKWLASFSQKFYGREGGFYFYFEAEVLMPKIQ